jgi:hypothetical protein
MTHALCDACETAETCWRNQSCFEPIEWQAAHGVVSVEEYDDFTLSRTLSCFALIRYLLIAIASVAACAFVGGVIARWMA